jgi:hypothetical protein
MSADENELTRDMMASLAGVAVVDACGGPKKIASAASVDPSNGRRWARGERSNPIYRAMSLLERAADPWPLVALFAATAARALLRKEGPMPEWKWRQLYVEACHAEGPPDGHEDTTTTALLTGKATVACQFDADRKVIAATMRRLALGYIGMVNKWTLNGPRGS